MISDNPSAKFELITASKTDKAGRLTALMIRGLFFIAIPA